ncbi:MAG: hypothetical protein GXO29_01415 [Thermotogae bacterium]|nr:hypothetical protein [Thermotogota bacterium]
MDSGLGGLVSLREFRKYSKGEVVYLGDLKHQPYGARPRSEIVELSKKAVSFLLDMGAEEIFVVCNTIAANALGSLRASFNVPIHGITEWVKYWTPPKDKKLIAIGTRATVESGYYQRVLGAKAIAAPELALLIEEGHWTDAVIRAYLDDLLPHGKYVLILGCTHYPITIPVIKELRPEVEIVDPAEILFRNLRRDGKRFFAHVFLTREHPKYEEFLLRLGYSRDDFSLNFLPDY